MGPLNVPGYDILYSVSIQDFDVIEDRIYHCLHPGRLLILPVYLPPSAFNFVVMSSYDHFCFIRYIRSSAFPHVNSGAPFPSAEGSLRDA
jgi:hypothetical protein